MFRAPLYYANTLSRLVYDYTMTISLSAINIYPVKALGAIALTQSLVTPRGLQNDRRFMVVDANDEFLTQRDYPKMASVWVEIENGEVIFSVADIDSVSFPATPGQLPTRPVQVWAHQVWAHQVGAHAVSVAVDRWLSEYLGIDARLVYMPDAAERRIDPHYAKNSEIVSFADGYPLLVASEASLIDLNARIVENGGQAIPMNRFRPNLVITGCKAYAEDELGEIVVGDCVFRAVKACTRCQVTTTDQSTGIVRGPEPLQTLGRYRDSANGVMFGMNLIPVTMGTVRVGDTVRLPG